VPDAIEIGVRMFAVEVPVAVAEIASFEINAVKIVAAKIAFFRCFIVSKPFIYV
jgi:hypothetical protein